MIKPAKVIKSPDASDVVVLEPATEDGDRARILRRVFVEASERAAEVLARAEQQAQQLLRDAELAATDLRRSAADEGFAQGYAEVLTRLAVVARLEADVDRRGLERSVEIARVLAERLIGSSLTTEPSVIAGLATQVLAEVRGARRIELRVHHADVATLQQRLGQALAGLSIVADGTCARGDFRVVTDVGTIDAKLGDRLDLLAVKLAEALRKST